MYTEYTHINICMYVYVHTLTAAFATNATKGNKMFGGHGLPLFRKDFVRGGVVLFQKSKAAVRTRGVAIQSCCIGACTRATVTLYVYKYMYTNTYIYI